MNNSAATTVLTTTLTVEVSRVTWTKPDGSWVIAQTRIDEVAPGAPSEGEYRGLTAGTKIAVVGPLGKVAPGDLIDITATVVQDRRYGRQLKASYAERTVRADDRAIQSFLRGFNTIGKARAAKITSHFGGFEGVIDVLDNAQERLVEVDGIGPELAAAISAGYHAALGRRDALLFTVEHKLPQRIAARVIDTFGGSAREVITADPYVLMELRGVGFQAADDIARTRFDVAEDDPRRTAAAAAHVLDAATNDGHVFSTLDHLTPAAPSRSVQAALKETKLTPRQLEDGLKVLSKPRSVKGFEQAPKVVIESGRYFPVTLHVAQKSIAKDLARLLQA